jgi:hypothetical protein
MSQSKNGDEIEKHKIAEVKPALQLFNDLLAHVFCALSSTVICCS